MFGFLDSRYLYYIWIYFGAKQRFHININDNDNPVSGSLNIKRGGSPDSDAQF